MQISVVIPTCDRRTSLLSTLKSLSLSTYALSEVIIVDSGSDRLTAANLTAFAHLPLFIIHSDRSVCLQRNIGIRMATSPLVFLCDDDIQTPPGYIRDLADHLARHPDAGAASGLVLQKEGGEWTASYPLRSPGRLLWNYLFGLSIWGEIDVQSNNPLIKKIVGYYRQKGNHITRAGWPVITDHSGDFFTTPLYGLGASLIKKEWLLASPYDEELDAHGIGDNYGVAMGFPVQRIDVLTTTQVYHHQEPANRLQKPLQYFRRAMALDHFIDAKKLSQVKRPWLLWSLLGNLFFFLFSRNGPMIGAAWKSVAAIAGGQNPYRPNPYRQNLYRQNVKKKTFANAWLWIVFMLYAVLLGYGCLHHEVWGDELHSWNISKGSGSYLQLIANRQYEGHPPGWYTVLWTISKFTHRVGYMQAAQWGIAVTTVFILLFFSPFPEFTKTLIPFGYYFLWEFGVFSRNYNLAILLAFCICLIIRKEFRYKTALYYALLFSLSNVHLLALLLAVSLHVYFLLLQKERKKNTGVIAAHAVAGLLVLLPAVKFILPPGDSQMNMAALLSGGSSHHFYTLYELPIRAFFQMPAWWQQHFWNTHFLLTFKDNYTWLQIVLPVIALLLLVFAGSCLWPSKKCLALFTVNVLLSFFISVTFFALLSARYSGFMYIGFIVACWLYYLERPEAGSPPQIAIAERRWTAARPAAALNILVAAQLAGGLFAYIQDIRRPFSYGYTVTDLLKEIPAGNKWVTDYWTMNTVVAFTDRPAYCIDMQRNMSFVLWASDLAAMQKKSHRYSDGLQQLFAREPGKAIYMLSHAPLAVLEQTDGQLATSYRVSLADSRVGAIDKGSDLYLYRIEPVH